MEIIATPIMFELWALYLSLLQRWNCIGTTKTPSKSLTNANKKRIIFSCILGVVY